MKKHLLLNVAGVAVLSLMCACGPQKEETKKEAMAEVPESVQAAANEALAQAEPAPEVPGEESTTGEEPAPEVEAVAAADAAPAPAAEPAKA